MYVPQFLCYMSLWFPYPSGDNQPIGTQVSSSIGGTLSIYTLLCELEVQMYLSSS
jgi:hypothetical protein